jgi:pyruvate/2-oxoglutarate dehydrogenase complex dihydrolipoamide acyltransferase (E2) component
MNRSICSQRAAGRDSRRQFHPAEARAARAVEFIDAIGLSLTCDHQVIDGAPGAWFLKW